MWKHGINYLCLVTTRIILVDTPTGSTTVIYGASKSTLAHFLLIRTTITEPSMQDFTMEYQTQTKPIVAITRDSFGIIIRSSVHPDIPLNIVRDTPSDIIPGSLLTTCLTYPRDDIPLDLDRTGRLDPQSLP
jgi:hypothetical protein